MKKICWTLVMPVLAATVFAADPHPKEYYRYYDGKVKLLPLSDKGISGKDVKPRRPDLGGPQPAPEAVFAVPQAVRPTAAKHRIVPVEIRNDNPAPGTVHARFGVPFPGKLMYDLDNLRVIGADGAAVPFQSAVTAWWPDKSVKWALIQFDVSLPAKGGKIFRIEYGSQIPPAKFASPLRWSENDDAVTVDTGVLRAVVNRKKFNLLDDVRVNGRPVGRFSPDGLVFRDGSGAAHTSAGGPPPRVRITESGPVRLTVQIDGALGNSGSAGSYIVKLCFYAGSAEVGMDVTYVNSSLVTEFNDFTDLTCRFLPAAAVKQLTMDRFTARKIFQHNDRKLQTDDKYCADRISGGGTLEMTGGKITFALRDAAFRYPKAFAVGDGGFDIGLLPELPSPDFGRELPHYLQFPFCSGKYRMKWGMSFTESMIFDFSGAADPAFLAGKEAVPAVNRDYIAGCRVFHGVPRRGDEQFRPWDKLAVSAFYSHMGIKAEQREYGFLNYGDWFGERGRNWTNNEYDMAHGLFMLYMRTGDRELFRWACRAARHQADVDIIHAYPDPFYHGCNAQHGIGHTGMNCHLVERATWALPLDSTFIGTNGHTWCDGMLEAWVLTGDTRAMDSSLKLGEHLVRFIAPTFSALGTHERSAGWSLKALSALYKVTADDRYLAAARRIAQVALREQKPDQGGAWPHKLPRGHVGTGKDTPGNVPFLIGTLMCGLDSYCEISGDKAVPASLAHGSRWLRSAFDRKLLAWPYSAGWDGKANFSPKPAQNLLAAPAMMSDGSKESYEIAKKVMAEATMRGFVSVGKSLAMRLSLTDRLMEHMFAYERKHPEAGHFDFVRELNDWSREFPERKFRIRFPEEKHFFVILDGEKAEIAVDREKYGSRPKFKPRFTVTVLDPSGKKAAEDGGNTTEPYSGKFTVSGKKGDRFKVVVRDDMTGIWDVKADGGRVFAKLFPQSSIAHNNPYPAFYYLTVPAGTEKFSITAESPNDFCIWIVDPAGKPAGFITGVSPKHWKHAPARYTRHLTVPKSSEARVYQLIVWNPSHLFLKVDGFDAMLSTYAQGRKP